MIIRLIDTIEWSRFYSNLCFESSIELKDILPAVGKTYSLPLHRSQHQLVDGNALIIWKPPLSDLEGWCEARPSEILKSFVIEGKVETNSSDIQNFSFTVIKCHKLTDFFQKVEATHGVGCRFMPSKIGWQHAEQIKIAYVGKYIYLDCMLSQEVWGELILSKEESNLRMHYNAYIPGPSVYETVITNIMLEESEKKIMERIMENAEVIVEKVMGELSDSRVYGVRGH